MKKTSKVSLSFTSLLLMFCLLFQFVNTTSAAAAPASQTSGPTPDVRVVGQPRSANNTTPATTPNTQQAAAYSGVYWTPIMTEGFESTFPHGAWTSYDNDGATNGEYFWATTSTAAHSGSFSAWPAKGGANGVDPSSASYPNSADSWLVYGPIDLSSYTAAKLQFQYSNKSESGADFFGWYASADNITYTGATTSGDSAGWVSQTLDITPYAGDSSVWIAFNFTSDAANVDIGPFVDDISLSVNKVFDSEFKSNAKGWGKVKGNWAITGANYYTTPGIVGKVASIAQTGTYSTIIDYTVRIKRLGCVGCANRIYVRGTPGPVDSYYDWSSGYIFQYTNNQYYSIWEAKQGVFTMVKGWTKYAGIRTNNWNTLRVVAKGVSFKYYINGILVWAKSIRGLTSGKVGIGLYRDPYSTGNTLSVDWASMSITLPLAGAATETDTFDLGEPVTNWDNPNIAPTP